MARRISKPLVQDIKEMFLNSSSSRCSNNSNSSMHNRISIKAIRIRGMTQVTMEIKTIIKLRGKIPITKETKIKGEMQITIRTSKRVSRTRLFLIKLITKPTARLRCKVEDSRITQ